MGIAKEAAPRLHWSSWKSGEPKAVQRFREDRYSDPSDLSRGARGRVDVINKGRTAQIPPKTPSIEHNDGGITSEGFVETTMQIDADRVEQIKHCGTVVAVEI